MRRSSFLMLLLSAGLFQNSMLAQSGSATVVAFEFSKTVTSLSDSRARAVAFHSFYFVDSYGSILGDTLLFGTPVVDQMLGEGWFTKESDNTIGSYQWAGGSGKKAVLSIQVPNGAEGLVVKVLSIQDSLRMDVRIGGSIVSSLLVDTYWHSGYIPVGLVMPEPRPNKEPVWTQGLYFPKFPRTDSVYVIHVHTTWGNGSGWNLSEDVNWRLRNYNDMTALTLVGMQGIINRYGARVHFEWEDPFHINSSWIPTIKENIKTKVFDFDGLSAINFLYRRFASYFSGAVIYEPEVPETINLATMFAGVDNAIIVAPGEIGLPGVPQLATVNDLRTLVQQYGWKATNDDQTRIYQWVYDNLWSRLDHRIFGLISPGPPTSRAFEPGSSQYFSLETIARDYLIALKLPCVYLHPQEEPQKSLLARFLDASPSPIAITGSFAGWEDETEQIGSTHGDMNFGLTWPEQIFNCGNFSVFASIDTPPAKYVPKMDPQKILKFCSGAPAATMFPTDGDATNYTMQHGYDVFDWRNVQGQNSGWTIASYLWNLAPPVWNYYVKTAVQISLLSDVNGAGYMNNWCMNDTEIVNYLRYTARYLEVSGLDVIHIFEGHNTSFWTGSHAAKYYTYLHTAGYKGSILGYNNNYYRGFGLFYAGSPAPTVRTGYRMHSHNLDWVVNELTARKPGEELYYVSEIRNIQGDLVNPNSQYVSDSSSSNGTSTCISKANQNAIFFTMDNMILAPGRYEATFRLKVSQNTSPTTIVRVSLFDDGQQSQHAIFNRSILASEFTAPGKYQDFVVKFTLNDITTDLRWVIVCGDGSTDLYADNVRTKNLDGANLPITGTIVIDNLNINERGLLARVPEMFTSKFELKGGVVLNPSEYVAALNPEYMIEFAKPILGSGHPAIADAQSKFSAGKYFESMMAIRIALGQKVSTSPLAPVLLSPAHQSPNLPVILTLGWSTSVGATKYHLQVSKDSLFSQLITNDSTITTTSYQMNSLTNSTTYYWRVKGKTATGSGDWSTVWSFTTTRGTMSLSVNSGWNIISVPLQALDMNLGVLFPDATSQAFGFSNGYVLAPSLIPGKGYWLKFPTGKNCTVDGTSVRPASIALTAGWNMVGPFDFDVPTSSVTSTPAGIVASAYFGFNNGYTTATTLTVGKGYWVKVSQAGTLTLQPPSGTTAGGSVASTSTESQETNKVVVFTFEDNAGRRGTIRLAEGRSGEELPPVPPEGILDIRFRSNTTTESMGSNNHEVMLSSVEYPVTIIAHGVDEMELWMLDGVGGTVLKEKLEEGKKITIAQKLSKLILTERKEELPTQYELSQNYPNPFNPTTTIGYALPKQSLVTLTIYDLLGREIETLVSKELPPGYYTAKWAANVPSGVYIYRIRAGEYVASKKMILLH
ncbi:MAG: GxGYxYP family putative glycoside hydrolase [Ignavibacteriales bacterium]|nr:GxGYxYP family putative glycoside hydrolase [Ignavibacteriales bacterium]